MKLSRGFIVVILILFVLLVLVEVKIPKRFNWNERTYSHNDPNPFGSMLVDSLLESSVKCGYEVKPGFLYDAFHDSDSINTTILLVDYDIEDWEREEIDMFLKILKRGQNIVYINDYLCDSLGLFLKMGMDKGYDYYSPSEYFSNSDSTTFIWKKDSVYDKTKYRFRIFDPYNSAIIADFDSENSEWTPLLHQKLKFGGNIIAAASREYGKGKCVVVTWPQLFTNYNVLEKDGAQLLLRIISQVGDVPIVRYDSSDDYYYEEKPNESQSPLRVFLDNRSLRWAIYLTLFTILLSLFFTARRRQRVIPVVEPPKNQTLTMVKHIGLMHYRHHDNTSLVRDHYKHFSQEMMRKLLVDVNDDIDLNENLPLIKSRANIDAEEFKQSISRMKEIAVNYDIKLTDSETKSLIDIMNNITNNL
jgi:hypothetical protein